MQVIPELVIYDNSKDREAIELACEAAEKTGWQPEVFTNPVEAAEAIGFFTRAVITAVDRHHQHYYGGMSPYDVTNLLEIPRAVLLEHGMHGEQYVRSAFPDVAVPRRDSGRIVPLLSVWLESL